MPTGFGRTVLLRRRLDDRGESGHRAHADGSLPGTCCPKVDQADARDDASKPDAGRCRAPRRRLALLEVRQPGARHRRAHAEQRRSFRCEQYPGGRPAGRVDRLLSSPRRCRGAAPAPTRARSPMCRCRRRAVYEERAPAVLPRPPSAAPSGLLKAAASKTTGDYPWTVSCGFGSSRFGHANSRPVKNLDLACDPHRGSCCSDPDVEITIRLRPFCRWHARRVSASAGPAVVRELSAAAPLQYIRRACRMSQPVAQRLRKLARSASSNMSPPA